MKYLLPLLVLSAALNCVVAQGPPASLLPVFPQSGTIPPETFGTFGYAMPGAKLWRIPTTPGRFYSVNVTSNWFNMQLKVGACSVNSEFANAVTSSGVVPAVARASACVPSSLNCDVIVSLVNFGGLVDASWSVNVSYTEITAPSVPSVSNDGSAVVIPSVSLSWTYVSTGNYYSQTPVALARVNYQPNSVFFAFGSAQYMYFDLTDQGENCPATRLLYKTQVAPGNFYLVRAYNEPVKGFGTTYYPSNGWASVSAYNSVPLLPDSGSVGVEDYKTSLYLWNPPTGTIVGKNVTIDVQSSRTGQVYISALQPRGSSPILYNDFSQYSTNRLTLEPCQALANGSFYIGLVWRSASASFNTSTLTITVTVSDMRIPATPIVLGQAASDPAAGSNELAVYRLPFNSSLAKQPYLFTTNLVGRISKSVNPAAVSACSPSPNVIAGRAASGVPLCSLFDASSISESEPLFLHTPTRSFASLDVTTPPISRSDGVWIDATVDKQRTYFFFGSDPSIYPLTVVFRAPGLTYNGLATYLEILDPSKPFCDAKIVQSFGQAQSLMNYTFVLTCPKIVAVRLESEYETRSCSILAYKPSSTASFPLSFGASTFNYVPGVLYTVSAPSQTPASFSCVANPINDKLVSVPFSDGTCKNAEVSFTLCAQANGMDGGSYIPPPRVYGFSSQTQFNGAIFTSPHQEARQVNYTWGPARNYCYLPGIPDPWCASVITYPLTSSNAGELNVGRYSLGKDIQLLNDFYPDVLPGSTCYEAVRRFSCLSLVPQCEPNTGDLIRFPEVCTSCQTNLYAACPGTHPYFVDALCSRSEEAALCSQYATPPAPTPFVRPGAPVGSAPTTQSGNSPSGGGNVAPVAPLPPVPLLTPSGTKVSASAALGAPFAAIVLAAVFALLL